MLEAVSARTQGSFKEEIGNGVSEDSAAFPSSGDLVRRQNQMSGNTFSCMAQASPAPGTSPSVPSASPDFLFFPSPTLVPCQPHWVALQL